MSSFEINQDLKNIKFTFHNSIHLVGSFVLALFFGFFWSYGLWFLWEIGDGYKKWYWQAPTKILRSKFPSNNWFKGELFYSDKFSLQDIFIFNFFGALIGSILRLLIRG